MSKIVFKFNIQDDDIRNLFFGNYMDQETQVYDEIADFKELTDMMEHYLEEYNQVGITLI